MTSKLKSG